MRRCTLGGPVDVQLRLVLAVLRDAVRHGEEHAGESSAGVSTHAGEEDVREPSQVDAAFHRGIANPSPTFQT